MAELIVGLALLVVAPFCALFAIWLTYRVVTKAQTSRSFTRRQEAWTAIMLLAMACAEAASGVASLRLLPATDAASVAFVEIVSSLAGIVAVGGLIDALIPGIWWLLLPWWTSTWLRPRSRHDASPRQ